MKRPAPQTNSDAWPMPDAFQTVGPATEFWTASTEATNKIAPKPANQRNFNAQTANAFPSNTNAMGPQIAPTTATKKIVRCQFVRWRNFNATAGSACLSNSDATANWIVAQGTCQMKKI